MVALTFALIALNGCGGNEDQAADTHEAGEHDEADSQATSDDHADDEHAETEVDDHADDEHAEAEVDDHAEAGHDEAEEDAAEHHGEEAEYTEPNNYAEAIHVIHGQLEKIKALMASGELDQVHAEAAVIRDVANTLAKFALAEDSGVPRDAVKTVNLSARALAATFEPIDEAGDSGDLAGTQKVYDEMVEHFESLEQYVEEHDDH